MIEITPIMLIVMLLGGMALIAGATIAMFFLANNLAIAIYNSVLEALSQQFEVEFLNVEEVDHRGED